VQIIQRDGFLPNPPPAWTKPSRCSWQRWNSRVYIAPNRLAKSRNEKPFGTLPECRTLLQVNCRVQLVPIILNASGQAMGLVVVAGALHQREAAGAPWSRSVMRESSARAWQKNLGPVALSSASDAGFWRRSPHWPLNGRQVRPGAAGAAETVLLVHPSRPFSRTALQAAPAPQFID
jgi:hypothetical protein